MSVTLVDNQTRELLEKVSNRQTFHKADHSGQRVRRFDKVAPTIRKCHVARLAFGVASGNRSEASVESPFSTISPSSQIGTNTSSSETSPVGYAKRGAFSHLKKVRDNNYPRITCAADIPGVVACEQISRDPSSTQYRFVRLLIVCLMVSTTDGGQLTAAMGKR